MARKLLRSAAILIPCLLIPASAFATVQCTLTLRLTSHVTIGAMTWDTTYPGSVEITGTGVQPDCHAASEGILADFFDDDAAGKLSSAVVRLAGIDGPADLVVCNLVADSTPKVSAFSTSNIDAVAVDVSPIDPPPSVIVSDVFCGEPAPVCGNGVQEAGEECDDGNLADGDGCSSQCRLQQICGDANDDGAVHASDALIALQHAIGIAIDCPESVCDVDLSGAVTASDALRILHHAVDSSVSLACDQSSPAS